MIELIESFEFQSLHCIDFWVHKLWLLGFLFVGVQSVAFNVQCKIYMGMLQPGSERCFSLALHFTAKA